MIHQHQFPFGNENKESGQVNVVGAVLLFVGIAITFWIVNTMAAKNALFDINQNEDSK
jgi:hypothetical protein